MSRPPHTTWPGVSGRFEMLVTAVGRPFFRQGVALASVLDPSRFGHLPSVTQPTLIRDRVPEHPSVRPQIRATNTASIGENHERNH